MADRLEATRDVIDDAVLDASRWPDALAAVADLVGAHGVSLLSWTHQIGFWSRVDPDARALFYSQFTANPIQDGMSRLRGVAAGKPPPIVTDRQLTKRPSFTRSAFYNDFMRAYGSDGMLVADLGAGDATAALNLSCSPRKGGFTHEDIRMIESVRPQLSRALWLGVRLGSRDAMDQGLLAMIERSKLGALIVDGSARVHHANRAAETLVREADGVEVVAGRLCAATLSLTHRLHALIAAATARGFAPRSGSMAAPALGRRLPLALSVTPIAAGRWGEIGGEPRALVSINDLEARRDVSPERLRELFGLTGAEARVALAIFDGATPREAAAGLGLSFNTVRAHLVRVYDKTGARRQAELASLLARCVGLEH